MLIPRFNTLTLIFIICKNKKKLNCPLWSILGFEGSKEVILYLGLDTIDNLNYLIAIIIIFNKYLNQD